MPQLERLVPVAPVEAVAEEGGGEEAGDAERDGDGDARPGRRLAAAEDASHDAGSDSDAEARRQ